ncbi:hypothetical protein FO440_10890 [Mucilaginibacter corticis]|uniref:Uncharacterized protein n=1 Tax=Mucilaginibacter corticis TaxID=2597670 RepID=A0A556MK60_9SPHI|nr:hypothetical protein [Mucilaginibacter corticis]TSJ40262.1 hypothetical protein FO440_10890 [Mucilaginibacter corticis]
MPCKSGKTNGPVLLPPVVAQAAASGKITNALAAARPNLFYLLSPEAFRLTVPLSTIISYCTKIKKRSAKASQGARPGVWPSGGGSDRPDLIFWLLLDQAIRRSLLEHLKNKTIAKKVTALAAIERYQAISLTNI